MQVGLKERAFAQGKTLQDLEAVVHHLDKIIQKDLFIINKAAQPKIYRKKCV
jgi:hypothetical protein